MRARIKDLTVVTNEMVYTDKEALQYAGDAEREMRLKEIERERELMERLTQAEREERLAREA